MRVVHLFAALLVTSVPLLPSESDFFERRIRPILAAKCYACHSARNALSQLSLDTQQGWRRGGTRGPAIVPGDPAASLLLRAVSHTDATLRMPPAGKLPDHEIAALTEWIRLGASGPEAAAPSASSPSHWSFQPLRPQTLPAVRDRRWPATPIDFFVLAALDARKLTPAAPASRRDLLRRVTFDLTGLPPTPVELRDFLADTSPHAWRKVVDRLLASPHYGERWGRHWLDLARFAETSGHEFDSEKPDAWRYRDYVVRAFNDDLPYDRFVREQIAGDLLPPRYSQSGALLESPLGGGFFALHEERNAADDLAEVRMEKADNQIDVLGKTFLGLTIACARCHDHKFDPIPTADYYSLAGILFSARQKERCLDSASTQSRTAALMREIETVNREILELARPQLPAHDLTANLTTPNDTWKAALAAAAADPSHVLYPLAHLAKPGDRPFPERLAELRDRLRNAATAMAARNDIVFADFSGGSYAGWESEGPAFTPGPATFLPPHLNIHGWRGAPVASSLAAGSKLFTGLLTSRSFTVTKPYLHVRMAGTLDKSRKREHGVLRFTLQAAGRPAYLNPTKDDTFEWRTTSLRLHLNLPAYFVIADRAPDGYIAVEKILFSDHSDPPPFHVPPHPRILALLDQPNISSLTQFAEAYQALLLDAAAHPSPENAPLLAALSGLGTPETLAADPRLDSLRQRRQELEAQLPAANFGLAGDEDTLTDARILVRGNPGNPGDAVPRRFLHVLSKSTEPFTHGSGRLELANAIASPANPLTARVFVNRVWKHHFGAGLVRSLDNFGATGDRPSHPELLDYLAARFIQSGWSVKSLHRDILLSRAYRMSAEPSPLATQIDPDNRFLQHMPVRRIEAESIRDAMLAVAGTLNPQLYGPSVTPHISPYQDGRGKPASGPLDANGRRSLYIQVRRNFLTPLLLAFDYPTPTTTIGQRGVTTVPSQALMMMNNEFVNQQAARWAARLLAQFSDPRERIHAMYVEAFARPPLPQEVGSIERFLAGQSSLHGAGDKPWTDLAHVLFNSKEFLFLR